MRDSGRVKIPGEGAPPEELAAFNKAIGVPDDAKGYVLPVITGADGAEVPLQDGMLGQLAESALKMGVPKAAYEGLVKDFVGLQMDAVAQHDAEQQGLADKWVKEQGSNIAAKTAAVNSALAALDLSGEDAKAIRSAIGADRALALFAKLGEGMSEDVMITGGRGRFGISEAEAQGELDKMKADPQMRQKIRVKGSPEALRWDRLNAAVGAALDRKQAAE